MKLVIPFFSLNAIFSVCPFIIIFHNILYFSCTGPEDDPFRPCFGCEGFRARQIYGSDYYNDIERSFISRQTGERFQTTRQSRRTVCRNGRANCKLRIDRGMQLRQRSYARAQEFVQSEQYLTQEDTDILRFFIRK